MEGRCERHLFDRAVDLCGQCGGEYCPDCLVYSFGPKKPPFCLPCAVARSGVRSSATQHKPLGRRQRRQLKRRRAELQRASAAMQTATVQGASVQGATRTQSGISPADAAPATRPVDAPAPLDSVVGPTFGAVGLEPAGTEPTPRRSPLPGPGAEWFTPVPQPGR